VDDEVMRHAYRNAIETRVLDEGLMMLLGPNRTGSQLLKVGVGPSRGATP
jgi:hypothetical protein